MSNEKMREEFEVWFCSTMPYKIAKESWFAVMDDGDYIITDVQAAWAGWKASRAATGGYCIVPSETIKKAYALASSVCGDCYAGEDTESLLANQLTKEISKSDYWMNMK